MSNAFEQIQDTYPVFGVSNVGWLNPYHPDTMALTNGGYLPESPHYPIDTTSEMYVWRDSENRLLLGAVASKFLKPGVAEHRQFVDFAGQSAYLDLSQAEYSFGSQSRLTELVAAMGMQFAHRKSEGSLTVSYAAVMPAEADDMNEHLLRLGVTDRRFVPFEEGSFSAVTLLRGLAKPVPEFPIAAYDAAGFLAVHDRAFHGLGHVMVAPEVLKHISEKSARLVEAFDAADAVIGGRPYYMFDGDEPARYFRAKEAIGKLVGKLDFELPSMSFQQGRVINNDTHDRLAHSLREIGITDKVECGQLATATLDWTAQLQERASNSVAR